MAHIHLISRWANEDPDNALAYWMGTLELDWLDSNKVSEQIAFSITELKTENLPKVTPLLTQLLQRSKPEHSLLGRTVSRCIATGAADDKLLWQYIAGDVEEKAVNSFNFDNKLHCQPYELESKNSSFLKQRMIKSRELLDLALNAIERWSEAKKEIYGETKLGYRQGFLRDTSYEDLHSQNDPQHQDSKRILMDSVEAAILNHAKENSDWWRSNRERLCLHHEGALCYFGILAVTKSPEQNIDLIGRMLCEENFLKFELSFEIGALIQSSFIFLEESTQDAAMYKFITLWNDIEADNDKDPWILKFRAEYICAIPCHLRSPQAQGIIDTYEKIHGTLHLQPSIDARGGVVSAPFSFEVFLDASDNGVVRLLEHYTGHTPSFVDFLVGGEREVGSQLREAASRHPMRFLKLLASQWNNISESYRDDIMDGTTRFLALRHGGLQTNDNWTPIETPDAPTLANQIIDELERHPTQWRFNRSASKALEACSHVVQDTQNSERLVFLAVDFLKVNEDSPFHKDSVDLLTAGINMIGGNIAEALMILASNLEELKVSPPELLAPALREIARNGHPAIRSLILRRLPYLQVMNPEFGWKLFHLSIENSVGLWSFAEHCLYRAHHHDFETIKSSLDRIYREGSRKDMETWGRISALTALAGHINTTDLLVDLNELDISEAWQGAASVWTHPGNIRQKEDQCLQGIETGLKLGGSHATTVARQVETIFRNNTPPIIIPIELTRYFFDSIESDSKNKHHRLFGFNEYINMIAQHDPDNALASIEMYLAYVAHNEIYLHDHSSQLIQTVTRLFSEAEEREQADHGAMLKRVVSIQDILLSLGINSINDWLKSAERQ